MSIAKDVKDRVYVAGAKLENGKLVTSGGRVVGCVGVADSLKEAVSAAYETAEKVSFENAYLRHDIGARALRAVTEA